MTARSALLVGSLPFDSEEDCMTRALEALGPHLRSLPDGEIGDKSPQFPRGNRIAWVMYAVEKITADGAHWRVVKQAVRGGDGMATNYQTIQKLRPRLPPSKMAEVVELGYDGYALQSYPLFERLATARGLDAGGALRFQMGVPTGFAMGFAFASAIDWIRYTGAFNTVIAREVNRVVEKLGDKVVVQLEVPPEMFLAYKLPTPLMGLSLRPIQDLVGKIRAGTRIGIHLCLGDFHNEALVHPKTLGRMVGFTNRLMDWWPSSHPLDYVHFPFSEGALPPPTAADYYRPLRDVKLPAGVRFVAGFVHERISLDENRGILAAIEQARGGAVGIATSCGLGRRTPEEATALLERMGQLIAS